MEQISQTATVNGDIVIGIATGSMAIRFNKPLQDLKELSQIIEQQGDVELRSLFNRFKELLRESDPDVNRLLSLWDNVQDRSMRLEGALALTDRLTAAFSFLF